MPAYAAFLTPEEATQLHHLWEIERVIVLERNKIIERAANRGRAANARYTYRLKRRRGAA